MEKKVKRNIRKPEDVELVEAVEETTRYAHGLETRSVVYVFLDKAEGSWFFCDPTNECSHYLGTKEALEAFLKELRI